MSGSQGVTRTPNHPVNSRELCQLSYLGSPAENSRPAKDSFAEILARPTRFRNPPTPFERLRRKSTIAEDGCWTWNGCLNSRGYGCVGLNGKVVLVHRLGYYIAYGEIPKGLTVDHLCHNADKDCAGGETCLHRRCWRPSHLEAVTIAENYSRSPNAGQAKTHCPQGHEYTEANTVRSKTGNKRCCRTCGNNRARDFYAARKITALMTGFGAS